MHAGNQVERVGVKSMRVCTIGVVLFLAAWVAGCGGNSTPVGVTVSPTTATVILNTTQQFSDTVTGTSTSAVTWFVCLPAATTTTSTTKVPPPIDCGMLTGFGTVSSTGLYTAPSTVPSPATFVVAAQSVVDTNIYGIATVTIDSGIRVSLYPTNATIGVGESYLFTPTVTGTPNTALTWSVTSGTTTVVGGNSTVGFICPNPDAPQPCPAGTYIAPLISPGTVTITATSAADPSKSGTASVTVESGADPTLSSISPTMASEGSVQQDVYLNGTNFLSTSQVFANGVAVPTIFISPTLLRATIPAAQLVSPVACTPQTVPPQIPILVQRQNGDVSQFKDLTIDPSRPAVVASSPQSAVVSTASVGVILTGGYFSPCTSAFFNAQPVGFSLNGTRVMNMTIAAPSVPGLYPIVVQNTDVVPPNPAISAVNLAVEPASFPSSPGASVGVGHSPSAIAIDPALNLAVVANSADNTVSIINLTTNTQVPGSPVAVGTDPTGVAIDYELQAPLHHIAVVVNSGDNSVTAIDLVNLTTTTLTLPNIAVPPAVTPPPFAIGINSLTHRALVALQSTNTAIVLDLSSGAPTLVQTIGGNLTTYGTGVNPVVAVDPRLNWAIVTPGGSGSINIVDLGRDPMLGDVARPPSVVASLLITSTVQGAGVNAETHQVLLTDPDGGNLLSYSMVDNTVSSVPFLLDGEPFDQLGFTSAAINQLSNVGIALNANAGSAVLVDMQNNIVLQTITGLSTPQAVAIDPVSNQAFIVNEGSNTVSVVSLGTPGQFRSLQIVESSPTVSFVANPTEPLTLTITGVGFSAGTPQVVLDKTPLPSGDVTVLSDRQLVAMIPASMLTNPRRYIVYVQSAGQWSNVTELAILQAVAVGNTPVAVAVDQALDQAVVTNYADNTVSIINLLTGAPISPGSPVSVGSNPEGIGVLPRLGLAVVANNGSNNVTIVDERGVAGVFNAPTTIPLCPSTCIQPTGVGINADTAFAAITNTNASASPAPSTVSFISLPDTGTTATLGDSPQVDQDPIAVAFDPTLDYAGVVTASQSSSLDLLDAASISIIKAITGFQLPTGIVFDPVNQDFLLVDSVVNDVYIVDPSSFLSTGVRVGINPTSLDYNFQDSTLVTANASSNTLSVVSYVCPPIPGGPVICAAPQARDVLAVGGLLNPASVVVGPNSVAIDLRLNLAVLVDQSNNRILLVPLSH
jgi:DNA-binding beta-propeller fold protein YncE